MIMSSELHDDDLWLACKDCGADFAMSGSERKFFEERGLYQPKRCPACRSARRQEREQAAGQGDGAGPGAIASPRAGQAR